MAHQTYQPLIRGSGNAAASMEKAICILSTLNRPYVLRPPKRIPRDAELEDLREELPDGTEPLLFIANPHGLHARYMQQSIDNKITKILCEKPVCATPEELDQLDRLPDDIAVFHGYRQMWGPQYIQSLIQQGELGELFSIEGHYLQSSATASNRKRTWKDDPRLSGYHDVALDLATHWLDLSNFLAGDVPSSVWLRPYFPHATSQHRDTHLHMALTYHNGMGGLASISKSFHGAGNELTIHAIGKLGRCTWSFQRPDQVFFAQQSRTEIRSRPEAGTANMPVFHGMGWIEGYIEVIDAYLCNDRPYPCLGEGKKIMQTLFRALEGG